MTPASFTQLKDRLADHAGAVKAALGVLLFVAFSVWWFTDPPVVVGARLSESDRVLILMHGHGATKTDLESLAEELAVAAPRVRFILPSAPHRAGGGRSWYPQFTADSKQAVEQRLLELRAEARAVVFEIVNELTSDGVSSEKIFVGGFSQGATVALDVVIADEGHNLGGLVSLSGGALAVDLAPLSNRSKLRAFVSHGTADRVTANGKSKSLAEALQEGDHDVQFIEFNGGHEIPPTVRQALGEFLAAE